MDSTSASLLERLRQPGQPDAWTRFVALYTPLLLHWARRLRLQPQDAADFVQEVFTQVVEKLPAFRYDPQQSFRSWLRAVAHNKWRDRQRRHGALPTAGQSYLSAVASPEGPDELSETEERQYLARRALEVMQAEVEPSTWKACWEFVAEGKTAAEVAAHLGISVNAVYIAKCRVLRRLRQQLQGLLD